MSDRRRRPLLADQQVALSAYLDSLLREVQLESETEVEKPAPVHVLRQPRSPEPEVPAPAPATESADTGSQTPAWAGASFQCLLFAVRGLTLAVPLEALCGIAEWNGGITKLPERPPWFLGVMSYREQQAGIIDTVGVVMPEQAAQDGERHDYAHIIFFDEGRWGLACERVDEVITLEKDQVRWRTSRTKRPWLAGTVIDQMCALLDVEALARMFREGLR